MAIPSTMPSPSPPIAIIGGGLAGLTLSICLSHNNIPHTIYESASKFAEIGAGIALGPNSVKALELLDPAVGVALKKCVTYNEGVDTDDYGNGIGLRSDEWLDVRVGMKDGFNNLITTVTHTGSSAPGRACFHRARFLDELLKLMPASTAHFGKALRSITPAGDRDENLILHFADGTTASASAVIACDGIKSIVRKSHIFGDHPGHPASQPQSTGEYAYRGMFTQEQFVSLTQGCLTPGKGTIFCGDQGYIVMYPVDKGALMNMVAIKREPDPSEGDENNVKSFEPSKIDEANWVQPVSTETMVNDFSNWGEPIRALLAQIQRPERWALFDHLPAPTYVKGKVAVMGDAAHASTPHQGQGAGMAFEDSLVLGGVLGAVLGPSQEKSEVPASTVNEKIEACFRAYDAVRRPRTQRLCRTSREMGDMIEFVSPEFGNDLAKIKENLDQRMHWIWDVDLKGEVQRAVDMAKNIIRADTAAMKKSTGA